MWGGRKTSWDGAANKKTIAKDHRLLLLKLDKQIGGTIYRPILAANEACHMEGMGVQ